MRGYTIPVRVPASARPPRATETPRFVSEDHPLAWEECPVCEGALGGREVHLVIVGADPQEARPGRAWFTGAAVAVHVECALPDGPHGP